MLDNNRSCRSYCNGNSSCRSSSRNTTAGIRQKCKPNGMRHQSLHRNNINTRTGIALTYRHTYPHKINNAHAIYLMYIWEVSLKSLLKIRNTILGYVFVLICVTHKQIDPRPAFKNTERLWITFWVDQTMSGRPVGWLACQCKGPTLIRMSLLKLLSKINNQPLKCI